MNPVRKSKNIVKFSNIAKHFGAFLLFIFILIVAGWIRIQVLNRIPKGQFTSTDAYRYAREVDIITKHWVLPKRDMSRWLPLGRDVEQALNLYPYVIAYTHKLITLLFTNVKPYSVQFFAPVVCFLLGMGILCFFLYRKFGFDIAFTVGLFLAVMPGTVDRSSAGFGDRDSWCWLLGILTVVTYLWKEQTQQKYYRVFLTLLSGFFMLLGGFSWEGFGVFTLVILAVEFWRFLTTDRETRLTEYLLWVFMFVPWLYLFSSAYQHGDGFTTHLTALVLFPPLVLLCLRYFRYFLTTHRSVSRWVLTGISGRVVALVLTSGVLLIGVGYVISQHASFATTTVPFSNNRLMQTVGELLPPEDAYWRYRFGGIFLVSILGVVGGCVRIWGKQGIFVAVSLSLLMLSTFFRQYLYHILSPLVCEYFFYIGLAFVPIAALQLAVLRKDSVQNEFIMIGTTMWFLIWMILTRQGNRYGFFIGFPIAFFAAICIRFIANILSDQYQKYIHRQNELEVNESSLEPDQTPPYNKRKQRFRYKKPKGVDTKTPQKKFLFTPSVLKSGIFVCVFVLLLFWQPPASTEPGSLATRSVLLLKTFRVALPGQDTQQGLDMVSALHWMKAELPEDTVIASEWSYGSILNVLGGVKTIVDQDHYIQHWIHLYSRHVFCAQSEREALEFLKTHDATHLMLTESLVLNPSITSSIGSDNSSDRLFDMVRMLPRTSIGGFEKYQMIPTDQNAPIKHVDIDFTHPVSVTAKLRTGKNVKIPYATTLSEPQVDNHTSTESKYGGILHHFDKVTQQDVLHYIPSIGWNSLAIKLFFREEHSEAFLPVYPEGDSVSAKVKIWKIHYPPDIKDNSKYLAKSPKK